MQDGDKKMSVHLKLTGRLDKDPINMNETDESVCIDVFEAGDADGHAVAMTVCEDKYLDIFYKHLYGGISLQKINVSIFISLGKN